MRPDAASLRALRSALPPFGEERIPPGLNTYLAFYGIDFAAQRPQLQHRVGYVKSGLYQLATHCWMQPGARHNLLLVHGYLDHVGLYRHLIGHALQHGCNVIAFDLPGHGLSTGTPAAIDDFAEYADAIQAVLDAVVVPPLPLQVLAQSTGGAALIAFARRCAARQSANRHSVAWPFTGTVLLAPLLRPAGWRRVRVSHALIHRFVSSVPRGFAQNSSDAEFLAFVRADPLQSRRIHVSWVGALRRWLAALPIADLGVGPALLVQGDADGTVDWRFNLPCYGQLFPGLRIELVHGAGHQLANESVRVREKYLRQVDRYLGWRVG